MVDLALIDNFRQNLRDACERNDINQQELAKAAGIHWVTVSRILGGKHDPTLDTCEKLARAAGVRPDTIFLQPVENPT